MFSDLCHRWSPVTEELSQMLGCEKVLHPSICDTFSVTGGHLWHRPLNMWHFYTVIYWRGYFTVDTFFINGIIWAQFELCIVFVWLFLSAGQPWESGGQWLWFELCRGKIGTLGGQPTNHPTHPGSVRLITIWHYMGPVGQSHAGSCQLCRCLQSNMCLGYIGATKTKLNDSGL